jgi:hypothetical protein
MFFRSLTNISDACGKFYETNGLERLQYKVVVLLVCKYGKSVPVTGHGGP